MAIQAVAALAPEWYVPNGEDADAEDHTAFLLVPISQLDWVHVMSAPSMRESGTEVFVPSRKCMEFLLKKCVQDWQNVLDKDGKSIPFDPRQLVTLPAEVIAELVMQITERANTPDDVAKKSG